jgi:hypothetical protein
LGKVSTSSSPGRDVRQFQSFSTRMVRKVPSPRSFLPSKPTASELAHVEITSRGATHAHVGPVEVSLHRGDLSRSDAVDERRAGAERHALLDALAGGEPRHLGSG